MPIDWNPSLNTGIDVIDGQHRRILEYINALEGGVDSQRAETMEAVLVGLVDYTQSHFAFEECLQEEAGFAGTAAHKMQHNAFIARIGDIRRRHLGGEAVVEELHGMLCTWLIGHIQREDMLYVDAVNAFLDHADGSRWVSEYVGRHFGDPDGP